MSDNPNSLFYGDCLDILKDLPKESVDLIYLDPPFNSNTDYNMLFGDEQNEDQAQARAFVDTWSWIPTTHLPIYDELLHRAGSIGNLAESLHLLLGRCGMLAYLLFMTQRIIEMKRVLKQSGSLYLHCDTSASHYLKIVLDGVFGSYFYRNDVTWKRATAHNDASRFGRISDRILFYTKSDEYIWNGDAVRKPKTDQEIRTAYPSEDKYGRFRNDNLTGPSHGQTNGESARPWKKYNVISKGRVWSPPKTGTYAYYIERNFIPKYREIKGVHDRLDALDHAGLIEHPVRGFWPGIKRYAEADLGTPIQDIILEPIGFTNYSTKGGEYLGYPTQKPLDLLKPLIKASTNEGDVVLDPFCGCGTAVDAAESLNRRWIGIDISCLSINLILDRLYANHGLDAIQNIEVTGIPRDMKAAKQLFQRNPFEFERWAVGLVYGRPNDRQTGDRGIDETLSFPSEDRNRPQKGIISIKGGKRLNPAMVRDLAGTVRRTGASIGILVTLEKQTAEMITEANTHDLWKDAFSDRSYPSIQIITIAELLDGKLIQSPAPLSPFVKPTKQQREQYVLV